MFQVHIFQLSLFGFILLSEAVSLAEASLFEHTSTEDAREFIVRDIVFIVERTDFLLDRRPRFVNVVSDSFFDKEGQNRLDRQLISHKFFISLIVSFGKLEPEVHDRVRVIFEAEVFRLCTSSTIFATELGSGAHGRLGGRVGLFRRLEQ